MSAYTYPGVYIQELPSGVHTITGVATSIAAFVGWANMGPIDRPVLVQSWQNFKPVRWFTSNNGTPNYLGYAVNQFFANGGQQAYIVRLVVTAAVQTANPSDTLAAKASVSIPPAAEPRSLQPRSTKGNGATAFMEFVLLPTPSTRPVSHSSWFTRPRGARRRLLRALSIYPLIRPILKVAA